DPRLLGHLARPARQRGRRAFREEFMSSDRCSGTHALLVAGFLTVSAFASVRALAATAADVASLSGPDRMQQLIDGAKKEGGLQFYTSATVNYMAPIIAGFEKKYG